MAIDGTYGFVYGGANGLGVGVFTIDQGRIEGTDFVGGKYNGTATEEADGSISIDLSFDVPPGIILVHGTSPQDLPHRRPIKHRFPRLFGEGAPQTVVSPPGFVTVMVQRVEDEYAPAARNGFSIQINEG